jgi:phosphomannomutase
MILNRMSQTDQTLSQIHSALPQYKIVKDKISLKGIKPDKIIKIVSEKFKDAEKNTLDGVKFIWKDKWVHFRKSNTEPIMRIYAEAPDQKQAQDLVNKVKEII